MKTIETLVSLKENVNESTYNDILKIMEGLFIEDGRGDLLDDVSKLLTNRTLKQHAQQGAQNIAKAIKQKVARKKVTSK